MPRKAIDLRCRTFKRSTATAAFADSPLREKNCTRSVAQKATAPYPMVQRQALLTYGGAASSSIALTRMSNSGGRTLFRRSRQPIHAPAWILPSILTMCVPDVRLGSGSACAANASLAPPKLLPQSCNPHGQTPFGELALPENEPRPTPYLPGPPDDSAA